VETALGLPRRSAPTGRLKLGLPFIWQGNPDPVACRVLGGALQQVGGPPTPWVYEDANFTLAWNGYIEVLTQVAPEALKQLAEPASREDVAVLRSRFRVPSPLLGFLARHDGERSGLEGGVFPTWRPLSVAAILDAWHFLQGLHVDAGLAGTPVGPTHALWWHPGWLPCATNESGDYLVLDLEPPQGGVPGQLVLFDHADSCREVVAPSIPDALWQTRIAIEDGSIAVLEEDDGRFAMLSAAGAYRPENLQVRLPDP